MLHISFSNIPSVGFLPVWEILRFNRGVAETFVLQGCYVAYRSLLRGTAWPLRMGPTGWPKSRYNKWKSLLSNILEERRPSRWHTVFRTQNMSVGGFTGAPLPQGWLCLCSGQSHFSYLMKVHLCPIFVITGRSQLSGSKQTSSRGTFVKKCSFYIAFLIIRRDWVY
jgi:hypothetical protein